MLHATSNPSMLISSIKARELKKRIPNHAHIHPSKRQITCKKVGACKVLCHDKFCQMEMSIPCPISPKMLRHSTKGSIHPHIQSSTNEWRLEHHMIECHAISTISKYIKQYTIKPLAHQHPCYQQSKNQVKTLAIQQIH